LKDHRSRPIYPTCEAFCTAAVSVCGSNVLQRMMLQELIKCAPNVTLITTGDRPIPSGQKTQEYLFLLLKASTVPEGYSEAKPPTDAAVLRFLKQVCAQCTVLRANKVLRVLRSLDLLGVWLCTSTQALTYVLVVRFD
jgi:hypothetical protein